MNKFNFICSEFAKENDLGYLIQLDAKYKKIFDLTKYLKHKGFCRRNGKIERKLAKIRLTLNIIGLTILYRKRNKQFKRSKNNLECYIDKILNDSNKRKAI